MSKTMLWSIANLWEGHKCCSRGSFLQRARSNHSVVPAQGVAGWQISKPSKVRSYQQEVSGRPMQH